MKKLDSKAGKFQVNMNQVRDLSPEEAVSVAGGGKCSYCTTTSTGTATGILPGGWFTVSAPTFNFQLTAFGY